MAEDLSRTAKWIEPQWLHTKEDKESEEKKQERKQEGTEQLRSRRRSRKESEEKRSASDLLLPNNSISDLRVAKGSTRDASKARYLHWPVMDGDAAETRVERRQDLVLGCPLVTPMLQVVLAAESRNLGRGLTWRWL